MDYREIGKSGMKASVVGLGCWVHGGAFWGKVDDEQSIQAIQRAVDIGMNLIDTAPYYGTGHSEEIVGRALQGRRDKAILATKCGLNWHERDGEYFFSDGAHDVFRNLSTKSIRKELEDSLRRLKTDRIDLYQTHWQTQTTPVRDTMAELMKMREEGKIRAIGVSNASPEEMDRYLEIGPIESNQILYNMLSREGEQHVVPYCQEKGISVLAYSPLAQGLLTGKVRADRAFPESDLRAGNPWVKDKGALARLNSMLERVFLPMAERHDATIAQVAVAWTVAQSGITFALCGGRSPEQVDENAVGGSIAPEEAELESLRKAVEELEGPEG